MGQTCIGRPPAAAKALVLAAGIEAHQAGAAPRVSASRISGRVALEVAAALWRQDEPRHVVAASSGATLSLSRPSNRFDLCPFAELQSHGTAALGHAAIASGIAVGIRTITTGEITWTPALRLRQERTVRSRGFGLDGRSLSRDAMSLELMLGAHGGGRTAMTVSGGVFAGYETVVGLLRVDARRRF